MPSKFTVDGVDFSPLRMIRAEVAIRKLLDKLPAGSLLSTPELVARTGFAASSVRQVANVLPGYSFPVSANKRLWGSKNTIKQAEEALANHG